MVLAAPVVTEELPASRVGKSIEVLDLTPENIKRLTDKHIRLYERRLSAAKNPKSRKSYDVPELFAMLRVWSSIREKNHIYADLICCERKQVGLAIESGR